MLKQMIKSTCWLTCFFLALLIRAMEVKGRQGGCVAVGGSWILDLHLVVFVLPLNEN